jgi:CheY-like chemotaxis protein
MKTVFLVDESAAFLQYLTLIIKRLGYDTISASRACDCLEGVREKVPDMVICEANLPDGGGVELCRQIKSDPETEHAHVVVVTTDGSNGTRQAAMEEGASEFLTKPVTMRSIFNVLEHHIGFRRRKQIRTPYITSVKVDRGSGETETLETSNLGEGGMFIRSEGSEQVGAILDLSFTLNGSPVAFSTKAEVLYAFNGESSSPMGSGMGVRFMDLDGQQQFLLTRHIENYVTGAVA